MRNTQPPRIITRREALKLGLIGAGGLVLLGGPSLWAAVGSGPASASGAASESGASLAGAAGAREAAVSASVRPRAKAVIQIWMWGGPCHLDTFDPKPEAGNDFCGSLKSPIATNVDGIRIGELLPLLAKQADKYSILRGMTHGNNSHETASYIVQTGHLPGRDVYPCAGAVVSLFKGVDHGYQGLVAPYVVLTEPQGRFSEAGLLGPKYKPFATGSDSNLKVFAVEGIVAEGVTDARQSARRELMHTLDTLGQAIPAQPQFQEFDTSERHAYDLMLGDARKLFDLTQEKDDLRDRYGRNTFGQDCLMARRLVENGVPYVTINYKGWDTHKQHFETMRRKLPEMDQGMAALLQDLSERGLLDSTIVWWGGEFGRTPKVMWEAPWNGGRGHWGKCFTSVVAGGGFKGGHVVGGSDATGQEVVERPISPQDMIGSMYKLLGIAPDGPLPNAKGLEVKVLDSAEDPAKGGGPLKEIMVTV